MKVTVNEESKEKEFPKLMINDKNDLIIFMTSRGVGFVVQPNKHDPIGNYSDSWAMHQFKDFNGTVTLQND